jgi:hypothetical protein
MAIPANHGLAEAKGTYNTLQQGQTRASQAPNQGCGWVTQACGEEPVLVDEDFQLGAWPWLSRPAAA